MQKYKLVMSEEFHMQPQENISIYKRMKSKPGTCFPNYCKVWWTVK